MRSLQMTDDVFRRLAFCILLVPPALLVATTQSAWAQEVAEESESSEAASAEEDDKQAAKEKQLRAKLEKQAQAARIEAERQHQMAAKMAAALKEQQKMLEAQQKDFEAQRKAFEAHRKALAAEMEAHAKALSEQQNKLLDAKPRMFDAQLPIYEKVIAELQAAAGKGGSRDGATATLQSVLKKVEEARMEAREQENPMNPYVAKAKDEPLPENAEFKVFKLRFVKAQDAANAVRGILGGSGPRLAIDERTNMLLVVGEPKPISVVESVVQSLDEPGPRDKLGARSESLQLRVVWLLDGVQGKDPSGLVSPQVVEALAKLGFEAPAVVCQQVTTLTLDDKDRHGRYQFALPVLINGQTWQLTGNGLVTQVGDQRYGVEFELQFATPDDRRGSNRRAHLAGSIFTPLDHYTVMGTTTLVENSNEGDSQHLSAFVVYLDRAPEFPAEASTTFENDARR